MNKKLSNVERKNREVTDEALIKEHLHKLPMGFIASSDNGQPFINSNLFWYSEEEHVIYFHTKKNSNTERVLTANPKTCFSIALMGQLLPHQEALEFSTEYLGIAIFGNTSVVTDHSKIMFLFGKYFQKYFPNSKPAKGFSIEDAAKATMFKLSIDEWSCKMNSKPGYEGAFRYSENLDEAFLNNYQRFLNL